MRIPNPENRIWVQNNRNYNLGNLWSTFNIDLSLREGSISPTRSKLVYGSGDDAKFLTPIAFTYFGDKTYTITADLDGGSDTDGLFVGGADFNDAFSNASNDITFPPIDRFSDMIATYDYDTSGTAAQEDLLVVAAGTKIYDSDDGDTWNDRGTVGGATDYSLTYFYPQKRVYISTFSSKIYSMVPGNSATTSSTFTFDHGDAVRALNTKILSTNNAIYLLTLNQYGNSCLVFEWDGVTANTPSRVFNIDAQGVLSGTTLNDIPYIMTTDGRLMAFNGGGFEEVARLPVERRLLTNAVSNRPNRFIHKNGMTTHKGKILMNVNGRINDNAGSSYENFPSGIWEYDPLTGGLNHKYSVSYQAEADNGTTNLTDHGQSRVQYTGAIYAQETDTTTAGKNGQILFGAEYFTNASSTAHGVFIDDTNNDTQKYGHFTIPRTYSDQITDLWSKIILKHLKLKDSEDKIVVKYRCDDEEPTEGTITWVTNDQIDGSDRFTTTVDISDYSVGDEVEVTQGVGAGKCAHITSISENSGTYTVIVDETFKGALTQTAKARFQKWIKAGEYTEQSERFSEYLMGIDAPWIQVKVCLQLTGANEIEELMIINKTSKEAK